MQNISAIPVRIPANNAVTKRLGHWTTERQFEVRAHRGVAVLDLRSPRIPAGDIELDVDLDHATLKLLVADDAVLDDWDLRRTGRGRVKDAAGPGRPDDTAGPSRPDDTASRGRPDGVAIPAMDRTPTDPDPVPRRKIVLTGQLRHGEIRVHRGGIAILSAMFSGDYLADLRRTFRRGGVPTVDDPTRAG
jgi:hypothetical protein